MPKNMQIPDTRKDIEKLLAIGLEDSELARIIVARDHIVKSTDLDARVNIALGILKNYLEEDYSVSADSAFYILSDKDVHRKFAVMPETSDKVFEGKIENEKVKELEKYFTVNPVNSSGYVLFNPIITNENALSFIDAYIEKNLTTTVKNALKYGTDPLTGALKKEPFVRMLEKELYRLSVDNREKGVALLMIDLDNFKQYNDTLGHLAGNDLLREFADVLKSRVRASDGFARFGGDEFMVCMPDISLEDAESKTKLISNTINQHKFKGADKIPAGKITASIGLAHSPTHVVKADEKAGVDSLIDCADRAMYVVKDNGRGSYSVFNPNS